MGNLTPPGCANIFGTRLDNFHFYSRLITRNSRERRLPGLLPVDCNRADVRPAVISADDDLLDSSVLRLGEPPGVEQDKPVGLADANALEKRPLPVEVIQLPRRVEDDRSKAGVRKRQRVHVRNHVGLVRRIGIET